MKYHGNEIEMGRTWYTSPISGIFDGIYFARLLGFRQIEGKTVVFLMDKPQSKGFQKRRVNERRVKLDPLRSE